MKYRVTYHLPLAGGRSMKTWVILPYCPKEGADICLFEKTAPGHPDRLKERIPAVNVIRIEEQS